MKAGDYPVPMEIKQIPVGDLKPATYNPRKDLKPGDPEYEDIKKSLDTFGLVEPLVANEDMTLISGHQRLKIAVEEGWSHVPVVVVNLDKKKEILLNIRLNKSSGKWDIPRLKEVITTIDDGSIDIEMSGWSADALDKLFGEKGTAAPDVAFATELLLEHNYVVLTFDNTFDWQAVVDILGLPKVKDLVPRKSQPIGIGRVVNGAKILERLRGAK